MTGTTGEWQRPEPSRLAPGSQNWHQFPVSAGVPAFFAGARGPRVIEADGRELVDLYCGSGAIILGHAHPRQCAAVRAALVNGASVSLRHPSEGELAARLVDLVPWSRYAAFFKTGSEAVHAAITTAIKCTGRRVVLTTSYHGWLMPLGGLGSLTQLDVRPLDWRSPSLRDDVAGWADQAACIVVTPTPDLPDASVVGEVVQAARSGGAVIIADEVKSGFRHSFPTYVTAAGIDPDLLVVSKAVSNGFPIACVLGADLLADDATFSVFSTFASEIVSVAAALACLDELKNGAYEAFAQASAELSQELAKVIRPFGGTTEGPETFFRLKFPDELSPDEICRGLYRRGVLYHPQDQVIVSAAHGPAEIDQVCAAVEDTLTGLRP